MNFDNKKISKAYESVVNEKFKDDIIGVAPHIRTLAILTADNPFTLHYSRRDNEIRAAFLEKALSMWRIPYRKVIGHYGNVEHSYELINVGLDDVKTLAAKFNQQSFIYAVKDGDMSPESRKTSMSYHFFAYRSKFYDVDKEKFIKDNKDAKSEEERVYPTFNKNYYIEVDQKKSIDYHPVDAKDDDFYTRKNSYKFSVPFDYFDDKHMTDAETVVSDSVKRLGESLFAKRTDESINDKNTAKCRWENRVMLFGRSEFGDFDGD